MKLCNFSSSKGTNMTYGDVIRSLSDRDLAIIITSNFTSEIVPFCKSKPKCDEMLEGNETIPDEWCIECAMEYLKKEVDHDS